jgi:hypothetical protein
MIRMAFIPVAALAGARQGTDVSCWLRPEAKRSNDASYAV